MPLTFADWLRQTLTIACVTLRIQRSTLNCSAITITRKYKNQPILTSCLICRDKSFSDILIRKKRALTAVMVIKFLKEKCKYLTQQPLLLHVIKKLWNGWASESDERRDWLAKASKWHSTSFFSARAALVWLVLSQLFKVERLLALISALPSSTAKTPRWPPLQVLLNTCWILEHVAFNLQPNYVISNCVNVPTILELKIGQKLNEGKTKQIFELVDQPGLVLVQSKDQITAGNAARKDQMEGKAAIANKTTSYVFKLLQESGEDLSSVYYLWFFSVCLI